MHNLTENMQAIEVTEPGTPDVLKITERPLPQINEDEVLIQVANAGVNRPDVMQRAGLYPPPPGATDIPGLEVSGTVAALGKKVSDWKIGDTLCALVAGGGYAEYVAAPASQCLNIPKALDLREADALPETDFTGWSNVFDRANFKGKATLLLHGRSRGIGTTAIQICQTLGHAVYVNAC